MNYEIDDAFEAEINSIGQNTSSLESIIVISGRKYEMIVNVELLDMPVFSNGLPWRSRFMDSLETMCGNIGKRDLDYVSFTIYASFTIANRETHKITTTIKSAPVIENKKPKKKIVNEIKDTAEEITDGK